MVLNKRQKQLENNLNVLLGIYENGMSDCGLENYPQMSEKEVIAYCKGAGGIYDMLDKAAALRHIVYGFYHGS